MTEEEWWATAPEWAKWHTWDVEGKAWWQTRPHWDGYSWGWPEHRDDNIPEYAWYDTASCPIEIDPSKTLRRRPK